eukprot:12422825-Karenia_brevis.AAC.1
MMNSVNGIGAKQNLFQHQSWQSGRLQYVLTEAKALLKVMRGQESEGLQVVAVRPDVGHSRLAWSPQRILHLLQCNFSQIAENKTILNPNKDGQEQTWVALIKKLETLEKRIEQIECDKIQSE